MGSLSRGTKADQFSYVPAGTVLPFAGDTAPDGWALCDGTTINRADYPELYLAIGDAWGNGDGSTTFHLPDMRGRFMRGTDNTAGRDPDAGARTPANAGGNSGDAVGSVQGDSTKMPNNPFSGTTGTSGPSTITRWVASGGSFSVAEKNGNHSHSISVNGGGDLETAPVNININYIIKL